MTPDASGVLPRRPSPGAAGARLAQLYEDHARMVYGVCRLVLRDADEAEDATQQVFLSAYRGLLAGTEPRNAGAWLGTIARNEARKRAAQRAQRPVRLAGEVASTTASLEDEVDGRAEAQLLRAQIATLPEKQREAVILRDLYGLRYDEVARALNTSRPAVEALLFRGRRRLQRHLRPEAAATALAVPLALRESLAYAVPGFSAGGAASAGVLAKLAAAPVAAKLAAAGVTVGAAGSAGVLAEEQLRRDGSPAAPAPLVARAPVAEPRAPARFVLVPEHASPDASSAASRRGLESDDEDEREEEDEREDREDRDERADARDDEREDEHEEDGEEDERETDGPAIAAASPPPAERDEEREDGHEDPVDAADPEDDEEPGGAEHAEEPDSVDDDD